MILALDTGWTPDVLGDLPLAFKQKCHWALYARAISGPEGFPPTEVPSGASQEIRLAYARQAIAVDKHRQILFPGDDDG